MLDKRMNEHIISQRRNRRRRALGRSVQKPRKSVLERNLHVRTGLPCFLPLPGILCPP